MDNNVNNSQEPKTFSVPEFASSQTTTQVQEQNTEVNNVDGNEQGMREEIGEHDIVIDEDFQLNLNVSEVKNVDLASSDSVQEQTSTEVEIGTEQSGNITF